MVKKRIMIVDDDVVFADELKDILSASGYETIIENYPRSAAEKIRSINPNVVLLDINMPGKNGFDVVNELRYGMKSCNVPIIIMTGYYKSSFEDIFRVYGIEKCIQKPFQPADIIALIESI